MQTIEKLFFMIDPTEVTMRKLLLCAAALPLVNLGINLKMKNSSLMMDQNIFRNKSFAGFSNGALNNLITNKNIGTISLTLGAVSLALRLVTISIYKGETELSIPLLNREGYLFTIGGNGLSLSFIGLNSLLFMIVMGYNFANYNNFSDQRNSVHTNIFILLLFLITNIFLVRNLFLFYIFFESILPLLFLLIAVYGSAERISAAYYLFLYTFVGSILLLVGIIAIYSLQGTTEYSLINMKEMISYRWQCVIYLLVMIAIAVKIPLYPLHIWLPIAHSESVIGGSVLLAGIVLKLAVFAFVELVMNLLPQAGHLSQSYLTIIALVTLFYSSLATMRNLDNKVIIAYSSIAHMAIVMVGLSSNSLVGVEGGILLSIAHGFVSPALFILMGGVIYEKYHTRLIQYYRGIARYYPIFSIFLFIAILGNMGIPLSLNFLGELLSIIGSLHNSLATCLLASSTLLFSSAYSIWLYSRVTNGYISSVFGKTNSTMIGGKLIGYSKETHYIDQDMNQNQIFILFTLLYITVILGVFPNSILSLIEEKLVDGITSTGLVE